MTALTPRKGCKESIRWLASTASVTTGQSCNPSPHPSRGALHKKCGVRDPLPPTAAVPRCKGDNKPNLPHKKGESRVAAGGRSRRLFCGKPIGFISSAPVGASLCFHAQLPDRLVRRRPGLMRGRVAYGPACLSGRASRHAKRGT
jgi:hypothetical protein